MSGGYKQHGRRHGPGGSDPILGLGSTFLGEQLFYSPGSASSISGGGELGLLNWDGAPASGSVELLDLSVDISSPAILEDGVYAITLTVNGDSLTDGAFFEVALLAGYALPRTRSGPAAASPASTPASVTTVSYVYGNVQLQARVHNYDSVARDFYIARAIVLRLL